MHRHVSRVGDEAAADSCFGLRGASSDSLDRSTRAAIPARPEPGHPPPFRSPRRPLRAILSPLPAARCSRHLPCSTTWGHQENCTVAQGIVFGAQTLQGRKPEREQVRLGNPDHLGHSEGSAWLSGPESSVPASGWFPVAAHAGVSSVGPTSGSRRSSTQT